MTYKRGRKIAVSGYISTQKYYAAEQKQSLGAEFTARGTGSQTTADSEGE